MATNTPNPEAQEGFINRHRQALIDGTWTAGGYFLLGGAASAVAAAGGEIADQILSHGENFPGGTLGKIAGGLVLTGLGLVGTSEILDR